MHVSMSAGFLPFSKVFDLERLEQDLDMIILEWGEVKDDTPASSSQPGLHSNSTTPYPLDASSVPESTWASLASSLHKPISYVMGYFGGSVDTLGC